MARYIETTRFAALQLFNVIASVNNSLVEIRQNLLLITQHQKGLDALSQQLDAAREPKGCDPEKHAATVAVLESRIREYRESFVNSEARIKTLQQQLEFFNLSSDALRMAILQIAKQGISITYGGFANCPDGRLIGTQPIKTVIWESRNQAIHYEEGKYNTNVQQCFAALVADFDVRFSLINHGTTNLSAAIFDLLGWHDYPSYESDIKSLLEP